MKRKSGEPVHHDRWLVSYADLITLLFALFVILYAMSKADLEKIKKVNQSMREAFGDAPAGSVAPQPKTGNGTGNGAANGTGPGSGAGATSGTSDPLMNQARDAIKESLALESGAADLADKVDVSEDDRGLVVRLAARDFFDDGSVAARADLRPLLDRIAKVLGTIPNAIRVEGHADVEENPRGDWELSAGRAAWVIEYWIKRWGMDPARLSAAGLSHFHPLTQRRDDYSRGKNRRVEIIILRNPEKTQAKPEPRSSDHSV